MRGPPQKHWQGWGAAHPSPLEQGALTDPKGLPGAPSAGAADGGRDTPVSLHPARASQVSQQDLEGILPGLDLGRGWEVSTEPVHRRGAGGGGPLTESDHSQSVHSYTRSPLILPLPQVADLWVPRPGIAYDAGHRVLLRR